MLATKDILGGLQSVKEAEKWLRLISAELVGRLKDARGVVDGERGDGVWPRSLVLSWRNGESRLFLFSLVVSFLPLTRPSSSFFFCFPSRHSHWRVPLRSSDEADPLSLPLSPHRRRSHPFAVDPSSRRGIRSQGQGCQQHRTRVHPFGTSGGRAEKNRGFPSLARSGWEEEGDEGERCRWTVDAEEGQATTTGDERRRGRER